MKALTHGRFRGLDGTAQGALIARVYDDGGHR